MRDYLSPASLIGSTSVAFGLLALILAADGELGWTAAAVGAAAGLDTVDGLAARRFAGDDGGFGASLDSLTDLVSFGAAPALAIHLSLLHEIPVAGIAACLAFVLCGAWRLARSPLVRSQARFVGLPLPPAGVVVVFLATLGPSPVFGLATTVVLAFLMVSYVRFPTLSPRRR